MVNAVSPDDMHNIDLSSEHVEVVREGGASRVVVRFAEISMCWGEDANANTFQSINPGGS